MIDFIFGGFGAIIRWIFVYKFDSKKIGDAYNSDPTVEGGKNSVAGLFIVPVAIIIGLVITYFEN